jgi:hypothetical protein
MAGASESPYGVLERRVALSTRVSGLARISFPGYCRVELHARVHRRLTRAGAARPTLASVPERVGIRGLARILEHTGAPGYSARQVTRRPERLIQDVSIRTRARAGEDPCGDPKRNPDEPKKPEVCRART